MPAYKDLTDRQFDRLKVLYRTDTQYTKSGRPIIAYHCVCDCGQEIDVRGSNLVSGNTKSCGCLQREAMKIVGYNKRKVNTYDLSGNYGIGYTNKGEEFYFDLYDFEKIRKYCWWKHHTGYIATNVIQDNGKHKIIYLHKVIMNCAFSGRSQLVDHINGNKEDCRKSNLRYATAQQNNQNHKLRSNNKSGYSGVQWNKSHKVWEVCISIDGKRKYVGVSKDYNEAIHLRQEAEKKYYGEWVRDPNADVIKQEEIHNG